MDFVDLKFLIKHSLELVSQQKNLSDLEGEWFYFMHIPKTAGTSLRYALFDQFSATTIYPNNVDYYIKNKAKFISLANFKEEYQLLLSPQVKLLIGHFGLFPINNCRPIKPRTFSFFRDPVQRTISALNYHSQKDRRYSRLNIKDTAATHEDMEGSLMARHLGYIPRKKNIEVVVNNLRELEVVCLTEYFKESIQLLNKTFNWTLSDKYVLNQNRKTTFLKKSKLDDIKKACEVDLEIYKKAKEIFFEKCDANQIKIKNK